LRFGGSIEEKKRICVVLVNDCCGVIPSARNLKAGKIAMGTKSTLAVINETAAASGQLTRREIVRRLAAAGAAWPLAAASHPIHDLLRNDAVLDEVEKLRAADWNPLILNAQQNENLIAIAESIVPGSTKAQVNRFIDLLLSVDTPEHKKSFVDSLSAFEAESQKRFAKVFPALNEDQKKQLLTEASAATAKANSDGAAAEENPAGLHKHFENLKGCVSGAYYSSEIGMKELGWTPGRVFASFPGCEHPEGHH